MNKEKLILNIAKKNNDIVTTKEVTKNNVARTYITKLVKEHKLYRIDRGIYSSTPKEVDKYFSLQNKSHKIVFSHFTALNFLKVYKNIEKLDQITVNQGYNATKYTNYKVFYNSPKSYKVGLTTYKHNDREICLYDEERSVCDIIKDRNRFNEQDYYKFINYYFNKQNLNYKKLLEYSKLLRISKLVHHYLSLLKA